MKNKKTIGLAAVLTALLSIGFITLARSAVSETAISFCVEWVADFEQAQFFDDLKKNPSPGKAANFEYLLANSYHTSAAEGPQRFAPKRAASERDAIGMLQEYNQLTAKKSAEWFAALLSKKTAKRITSSRLTGLAAQVFGLPQKKVAARLKAFHSPREKWILRHEAAQLFYRLASQTLSPSAETALCKKWALDDPDEFSDTFGEEESNELLQMTAPTAATSTPAQPATPAQPSSPASTPVPVSAPSLTPPAPSTPPVDTSGSSTPSGTTTTPTETRATAATSTAPIIVTSPNGGETWEIFEYNYAADYKANGVSRVGFKLYRGTEVVHSSTEPTNTDPKPYATQVYFHINKVRDSARIGSGDNFKVRIYDWDHPEVYDESEGFFTITPADLTAPTISGIVSTNITKTSATIIWTTSEPANAQINYGAGRYTSITPTDTTYATSHSIALSDLVPATTYIFRVYSTDKYGNTTTSSETYFTTLP